jgi:hypothetical protein
MLTSPGLPKRAPANSRLISTHRFGVLLSQLHDLAQGHARLVCHCERPWASATFSGSRHQLKLEFRGDLAIPAGEALIAALPDHEFTVPGQLVADATVTAVESRQTDGPVLIIEIELLLLLDA